MLLWIDRQNLSNVPISLLSCLDRFLWSLRLFRFCMNFGRLVVRFILSRSIQW